MKKVITVLSILNLISLTIVLSLDESIYRQLGFSVFSTFHSYPNLPYATNYCNGDFIAADKDGYSLMTVFEDVNGNCLYTSYSLIDSSGREIKIAPKEILKYAYSDINLFIYLKDSANVEYWIQPIPKNDIRASHYCKNYANYIVSEQDINFTNLRMVNLYSVISLITLLVYCGCVIFFILALVAVILCLISLLIARTSESKIVSAT